MDIPEKAEDTHWNGVEKTTTGKHRYIVRRRKHHHRNRLEKFRKTVISLLIVSGISLCIALLISYITGGLPNMIDRIISKNIEKAIQNTTGGLVDGNLNTEALRNLTKNIDINKLKEASSKNYGGRDMGKEQSSEDYKDYSKHLTNENIENLKRKYKEKTGR